MWGGGDNCRWGTVVGWGRLGVGEGVDGGWLYVVDIEGGGQL